MRVLPCFSWLRVSRNGGLFWPRKWTFALIVSKSPVISWPSLELKCSGKTCTVQLLKHTTAVPFLNVVQNFSDCDPMGFPVTNLMHRPLTCLKRKSQRYGRPLQQVLTDSHVLIMALMHSGHAYACIATLSDALSRRQQGVAKRDARSGIVFSRHKECHGKIPACGGKFCCYFLSPPLFFFLFHPSHIFPSHCSIRE